MKVWNIFFVLLAFCVMLSPSVFADGELQSKLHIKQFEVNDINLDFEDDNVIDEEFQRGEDLEVLLNLEALEDVEDLEVSALIAGDKYAEYRRDLTYDFDVYRGTLETGNAKAFKLKITIPEDLNIDSDDADNYKLRIIIADADSPGVYERDFQLSIEGVDDKKAIKIDDFAFNPQDVVVGRAFTALVRVENLGDDTLDDLKVVVSVPELNIEDTEYLDADDEIEPDDYRKFEELLLRVPMDAKPGTYDVDVTVYFDKYQKVTKTGMITVVEEKTAGTTPEGKTIINVPSSQEFAAGTSSVYPIMIENTGTASKTYSITVSGLADWATYKLDPAAVVVVDGESSSTVLMTVNANEDAAPGAKSFVISVQTPQETKQIPITANIVGSAAGSTLDRWKEGLTIGLVVLVIILIILGLIIGFTKLRGSEGKNEDEQTYY